jgi:hypothetical protein
MEPNGSNQAVAVPLDRGNFTAPVRSIANAFLGGQVISTRNVVGSQIVRVRSQDEIWLVSARRDDGSMTCQILQQGNWSDHNMSSLAMAHDSDRETSTIVYVHGNQTNDEYARARGLQLYQKLFNRNACEQGGAVRFVVFAWRSEREKVRLSLDYKLKLDRSIRVGENFGQFLGQFESRNMLLLGFSLGGQVILSGLLEEQARCECFPRSKTGKYSVALITPALDPALESTCLNAIEENFAVSETVAFINRRDPAIRVSKALVKTSRPPMYDEQGNKASIDGLVDWCSQGAFGRIRGEDITNEVTPCHSVIKYADQSRTIRATVARLSDLHRGTTVLSETSSTPSALMDVKKQDVKLNAQKNSTTWESQVVPR